MNELALFAGAGGGILGGHLLGWRTVCAVEWADYPRKVLLARQRDGILPRFPIWDDVQTFDGIPWRRRVDVVSGGFPCQDISAAGKGAGIDGARSGMWFHMARIVREVRPRFVFVENSPMLTSRGLGRVLGDLAAMGYNAEWGVLGAGDLGAPHQRDRIWIVANSVLAGERRDKREGEAEKDAFDHAASEHRDAWRPEPAQQLGTARATDGSDVVGDANSQRCQEFNASILSSRKGFGEQCDAMADTESGESRLATEWQRREDPCGGGQEIGGVDSCWWTTEPDVGRVAHGVAHRVDRLKAIGNGQVPLVAALAFLILSSRFESRNLVENQG